MFWSTKTGHINLRIFEIELLTRYGLRASMSDVGSCYDNAVVERFFGSLKHDWIFKVYQPTRDLKSN
jgi:transposase InsO family protein